MAAIPYNGEMQRSMKNRWNTSEAEKYRSELAQRVYTSRLLGEDHTLVLHGGGNTSVKIRARNAVGDDEEILYVKGSGWDLETIEAGGFAPVRMAHLSGLARLEALPISKQVRQSPGAGEETANIPGLLDLSPRRQ